VDDIRHLDARSHGTKPGTRDVLVCPHSCSPVRRLRGTYETRSRSLSSPPVESEVSPRSESSNVHQSRLAASGRADDGKCFPFPGHDSTVARSKGTPIASPALYGRSHLRDGAASRKATTWRGRMPWPRSMVIRARTLMRAVLGLAHAKCWSGLDAGGQGCLADTKRKEVRSSIQGRAGNWGAFAARHCAVMTWEMESTTIIGSTGSARTTLVHVLMTLIVRDLASTGGLEK